MRIILITILLIISLISNAQTYPINEPFNSVAAWTCNNGSGLQTYGPGLNYLTTNIGNTPYPNSSTITMTSPVYSFTNCLSNLTVTFPINGRIENGFDFMSFQYFNAGAWVNVATHTGIRNNVLYSYVIPNTATRFRFRLVTDATINSYGFPFTNVYYYDIDYFNIDCSSVLPIELVSFEGYNYEVYNLITWVTVSESNNDYFKLERSTDGYSWETVSIKDGAGNSNVGILYEYKDYSYIKNSYNYYRLTQVDYNGYSETFNIIVVDNLINSVSKKLVKVTNLMGQEVDPDTNVNCVLVYYYSDGTHQKICKVK